MALRSGDGEATRRPFFRIALYGAWPWVSTMKPVHDVVDVYLPPEWVGDGRVNEGYDYKSTAYVNYHPLAITNSAYCVDKKDAGYDFKIDRDLSLPLKS